MPANWKAAQEAFMEAYHNFETHNAPNGANAQYDIFGKFVSRFIHNIGNYSPEALADYPGDKWRAPPLTENEVLETLSIHGLAHDEVPPGETARAVAAADLRKLLGEKWGVDLAAVSDSIMLDSIEYHLFPNMFFFPGITIPMVYRFRPNGDNHTTALMEVMVLCQLPTGAPRPADVPVRRLGENELFSEAPELGESLGSIFDQDLFNMPKIQKGMHNVKSRELVLANYHEVRIRHFHQTIDKYISGEL